MAVKRWGGVGRTHRRSDFRGGRGEVKESLLEKVTFKTRLGGSINNPPEKRDWKRDAGRGKNKCAGGPDVGKSLATARTGRRRHRGTLRLERRGRSLQAPG